jgi:iron complex transport system substrate-binding protein
MRKAGRRFCLIAAAVLAGRGEPSVASAASAPQRVMSISLCTDQLVLALLPPRRIASVTWLARTAASARTARAAGRVAVNHQTAEEVVRQKPDLVVAGAFTAPATVALIERLGIPFLQLPQANDFGAIRATTRLLGRRLGVPQRAEALLGEMDRALAAAAAAPLPGPPRVAAWDGSGNVPGRGTLYDAVVTAAGARNVGREPGTRPGAFHVEALLAAAPDILLHERTTGARSRSEQLVGHRLVRRYWSDRQVIVPQDEFVCGSPYTGEAALRLNQAIRSLLAKRPAPLPLARRAR